MRDAGLSTAVIRGAEPGPIPTWQGSIGVPTAGGWKLVALDASRP